MKSRCFKPSIMPSNEVARRPTSSWLLFAGSVTSRFPWLTSSAADVKFLSRRSILVEATQKRMRPRAIRMIVKRSNLKVFVATCSATVFATLLSTRMATTLPFSLSGTLSCRNLSNSRFPTFPPKSRERIISPLFQVSFVAL